MAPMATSRHIIAVLKELPSSNNLLELVLVFRTNFVIQMITSCGPIKDIAENGIEVVDPRIFEMITTDVETNPTLPIETLDITT